MVLLVFPPIRRSVLIVVIAASACWKAEEGTRAAFKVTGTWGDSVRVIPSSSTFLPPLSHQQAREDISGSKVGLPGVSELPPIALPRVDWKGMRGNAYWGAFVAD